MITKKIKEYGTKTKRQRIDINVSDGFAPGDEVVLIPVEKYAEIKDNILDLQNELMTARNESDMMAEINAKLESQIQNQKIDLDKIIEKAVTPIDKHYQKEIGNKDNEIKQLKLQLKQWETKTNQYNLDMQGLNLIDIAIFRKHKKLITDFNDEITILAVDPKIIDADAKAIPGKDDDQEK